MPDSTRTSPRPASEPLPPSPSDTEIDALAARVGGVVLRPGEDGYDDERAGFQTAFADRPAVIVGAADADDVRAAVGFAAANALPVAVRATGHGVPIGGDGAVLVHTRRMNGVRIDPEAGTASIGAGTTWEHVITEAARHGLAPLSGSAPQVGAVSYTLGGGVGLLARRHGFAADHVRSVDVVTADGRTRHVTAQSDPDLFWALRGGRDNFGVVTGLEVGLVPVTRLYGGGLVFDADLVEDVLHGYLRWTRTLPEDVTSSVVMMRFPDAGPFPAPLLGRHIAEVKVAATVGAEEGERLVAPLRAIGPRLKDTLTEMPFTASDAIFHDPTEPHGYTSANALLGGTEEQDEALPRTLLDTVGPDAPVMCIVEVRHLGGALARPPAVASAVGHREARYLARVLSPLDGHDPAAVAAVHRGFVAAVAPRTVGRSLNFTLGGAGDEGSADVRAFYRPEDYRRLAAIKAAYDPGNTFRANHNIAPDPGGAAR